MLLHKLYHLFHVLTDNQLMHRVISKRSLYEYRIGNSTGGLSPSFITMRLTERMRITGKHHIMRGMVGS